MKDKKQTDKKKGKNYGQSYSIEGSGSIRCSEIYNGTSSLVWGAICPEEGRETRHSCLSRYRCVFRGESFRRDSRRCERKRRYTVSAWGLRHFLEEPCSGRIADSNPDSFFCSCRDKAKGGALLEFFRRLRARESVGSMRANCNLFFPGEREIGLSLEWKS